MPGLTFVYKPRSLTERSGWKGFSGTNTQAYFDSKSLSKKKVLIARTPKHYVIKLFTSVTY
jgi:hypothetical protein